MGRPGRKRKAGAREPNGRLKRTYGQEDIGKAQLHWREFKEGAFRLEYQIHPLLFQVERGTFDPKCFHVALHWAATTFQFSPLLERLRQQLTQATGFDFTTPKGCAAARRYAESAIGQEALEMLDRACLTGDTSVDVAALEESLATVWRAWCKHGETRRLGLTSV